MTRSRFNTSVYYYYDDYRYYYLLYIDIMIYNSTYSINKTTPRNVSRLTFRVNEGQYHQNTVRRTILSVHNLLRTRFSRPVYFYFVNSVLLCVFHIVERALKGEDKDACTHAFYASFIFVSMNTSKGPPGFPSTK